MRAQRFWSLRYHSPVASSSVTQAEDTSATSVDVVDPPRFVRTNDAAIMGPISIGHNWRTSKFAAVYEAVRKMADLPAAHDFHVNGIAAQRAEDILAILATNFTLDPPKVYPQESDCVVFTWDSPSVKRYLSVEEDEIDLMEINKRTRVRCEHELNFDSPDHMQEWLLRLGGLPKSSSGDQYEDV